MKIVIATMALGAFLVAGPASAADIAAPVMPGPVIDTPPPASLFDWSRAYVGIAGGAWLPLLGEDQNTYARAALVAGKNVALGHRFVTGIELTAGPWGPPLAFEAFGFVRAGFILGDRALVFGMAGLGWYTDGWSWNLGGGLEVAVGHNLSVRGETFVYRHFASPALDFVSVTGGLVWHFGR